jgi:hypothetical protein
MRDTRSVPSDFDIVTGAATLHVPQAGGGWRRGMFPSEEVLGEGGIVSTVDDMLRWLAHLRAPQTVGSDETWAQMRAPARLNNGMFTTYALGLMVERWRGIDVLHHGGTVFGGNCQMLTAPAHALDIILISNGVRVNLAEMANKVVEAVLGEAAFSQPPEATASSAGFAALVGSTYASPSGDMVVGFGDADGKLGLVVHNSPPVPMREESGALVLDFNRTVTGPYRVAIAAPDTLQFEDAGTLQSLARLAAAPPLAHAGRALVGRYRAADLGADATIDFDGEALLVRIAGQFGPSVLNLKACSDGVFYWNYVGEYAALGGTLSVERDASAVTALRLNTLRTRHLRFERIGELA